MRVHVLRGRPHRHLRKLPEVDACRRLAAAQLSAPAAHHGDAGPEPGPPLHDDGDAALAVNAFTTAAPLS